MSPFEVDGEWQKCPLPGAQPKPDVCPSGTWRVLADEPESHFHWRKFGETPQNDPLTEAEVYLWMGCVAVIDSRRAVKDTARVFLYEIATGKMWWRRYPYPLPDTAVRIDLGAEFAPGAVAHSLTFERGFDTGYATAWASRSEVIEALLSDGKGGSTAAFELDDDQMFDAARLLKIAEILGVREARR